MEDDRDTVGGSWCKLYLPMASFAKEMGIIRIEDIISTRRNIKSFKPDPLDAAKLDAWLDFARYAPNHRMTEPWEIIAVGPETRRKLNHKTDFGGAPVLLAILSRSARTPLDRDENMVATACFLQNFMLAAHADGVGTGISSLGNTPRGREILQVPDGFDVVGLVPVGYPLEVPEAKARTPIADKLRRLP